MKKIAITVVLAASLAAAPALAAGGKGHCPGDGGWQSFIQKILSKFGSGQAIGAQARACAQG